MAASLAQPLGLDVADLRQFRAADLRPLLDEQSALWSRQYRWDFSPSREAILRFLDMRNLYGYALLTQRTPVGYSYFVPERRKALLGDLFITERHRTEPNERFLLQSTLKSAAVFPGVNRIEGQLLGLSFSPSEESFYGRTLSIFPRSFMVAEPLEGNWAPHPASKSMRYLSWSEGDLDAAAELIFRAYEQHVDSLINDQYRSPAGARRFLYNSTQHPGCGVFFRQAALKAVEPLSGLLCGVCLGSLVQQKVGHITQLCVAPFARRRGVGYELMRRALTAFREQGCHTVSLTVTSSNRAAIELYESLGFRVLREFPAFVWESSAGLVS